MVLINSNPATIMTDPETADRTYIGPMTPELVEQIIVKVCGRKHDLALAQPTPRHTSQSKPLP